MISVESIIFMYVWIYCYNGYMERPYQRLGHYFFAAVYALILYVASTMYGSLKLGYLKTPELIYTHTIATICANAVSYIPIVLLVKHFMSPMPLVFMTAGQFAVTALWGFLANKLYRHVYPPRRVLLVYGSHPVEAFLNKMYDRSDCFVIGEQIKFADNQGIV